MRMLVVAFFLLLAAIALPVHAADLNRCVGANGGNIFTDKPCADVGATVRPEPAPVTAAPSAGRLHASGCARTTDALIHGVQSALAAGDVNQLAAFYHWPGATTASSGSILTRLQAIADRPLLSIDLIHAAHTQQLPDADGYQIVASARTGEASGLQIVQTRTGSDAAPVRTTFALTAYLGCWWIHF